MGKIPRIKFFNSVVKNKMPEAETSSIGELFINANAERPFISTKDSNGDMKKVIFEDEINADMEAEATARKNADDELQENLDNETNARQDADNTLTTNLANEEYRAKKSEEALGNRITDETQRATDAETTLTDNLNQEIQDRTSEVERLDGRIDTEIQDRKDADTAIWEEISGNTEELKTALSAETKAREDADNLITLNLNDEIARAKAAEGVLITNLNKEIQDRTSEVARLDTKVESETQRATNAETTLTKNLDKEIQDRKDVITTLTNKHDEDVSAITKSINDNKVKIVKVDDTLLPANVKEAFKLTNGLNVQLGETINIYKDSSLQKVELVDQKLRFTYNNASGGTDVVDIDVSKFLAETEFKNGLQVHADGTVYVRIADDSESYLTVDGNGLKFSGLNALNADINSKIEAETQRASDAETTLTNNLNQEIQDRTDEVARLDGRIAKETQDRKNADTAIWEEISGNTEELKTALSAETKAREDADNLNTKNLNAEIANRKSDTSALTKSITDEVVRAKTAEGTIINSINEEITNRTEADKALEAKIKAVGDTACKVTDVKVDGVSVVADKVANIDLSSKADVSALTAENTARENADAKLTSSITKEVSDRKSEITRVEGVIASETSARVSAITSLNFEIADLKANGGKIQDVTVNGVSVVANKVANIDLSNYLDKSTYNTDKQAIDDTLSNKADLVNGRIPLEQLGNIDTNILIIANDLPTSDIKENKIYLVPSQTSGESNVYTEYVYINSAWEILGSYTSSVDTSNFVIKSELEADEQAIAAAFNVIRKEYTDKFANYVLKADYDVLKSDYDSLKADYDVLKADYDVLKADVLRRLTAIESVDALDAGNY